MSGTAPLNFGFVGCCRFGMQKKLDGNEQCETIERWLDALDTDQMRALVDEYRKRRGALGLHALLLLSIIEKELAARCDVATGRFDDAVQKCRTKG
jgi:hypothetical protein